jgi:galactokinase
MTINILMWLLATVAVATCIVLVYENCKYHAPKMVYIIFRNTDKESTIYSVFNSRHSANKAAIVLNSKLNENKTIQYIMKPYVVYGYKDLKALEDAIIS